jgi:hypothetical protein
MNGRRLGWVLSSRDLDDQHHRTRSALTTFQNKPAKGVAATAWNNRVTEFRNGAVAFRNLRLTVRGRGMMRSAGLAVFATKVVFKALTVSGSNLTVIY